MQALQEAGFPLASDKGDDNRTRWTIVQLPLKALNNPGLSLTEVCSLYMSRALLAAMPGAAFADGLADLMRKVEKSLSPRVRQFLDQLPGVIKVKPGALKKHQKDYGEIVARLIEASSAHREAKMRYFSASSNREKDYIVHPYQRGLLRRRAIPGRLRPGIPPAPELRGGAHQEFHGRPRRPSRRPSTATPVRSRPRSASTTAVLNASRSSSPLASRATSASASGIRRSGWRTAPTAASG